MIVFAMNHKLNFQDRLLFNRSITFTAFDSLSPETVIA